MYLDCLDATCAAVRQIGREDHRVFDLWPFQTLDKTLDDGMTHWLTIYQPDESPHRFLYVDFDPAIRVRCSGSGLFQVCQAQVVAAIRSFWDGAVKDPERIVLIA